MRNEILAILVYHYIPALKTKGCDITHIFYYILLWNNIFIALCNKQQPSNKIAVDIVYLCTTKHDVWSLSKERRGGDRLKKIGRRKNFKHLTGEKGMLCLNELVQENRDFLFIFLHNNQTLILTSLLLHCAF
jgi:hypothetical protein